MAYARWGSSDWYIYWDATDATTRDTQTLALYHLRGDGVRLRYSELVGIDRDRLASLLPEAPRDAMDKALACVREFCADVEDEFP